MFGPVIFAIGLILIVTTLGDVFQSVIVPRPANRRLRASAYISRTGWRTWRWIGHRLISNEAREDFLGTYAPLLLIALLIFWVTSLILGYACVFYALRGQIKPHPNFWTAMYFAGTSFLTIGFGDIVPMGGFARVLSIATGATGFGIVAIVTTFLFAIFGAYQQREAFVVSFCNRASAPPSGVDLIEAHACLGGQAALTQTLHESQVWLAEVLETHLAYPVLTYFRSTHDNISWVGALGAMLDASTILLTAVDDPAPYEAAFVNRLARHFVNDFAHYFGFPESEDVGVERAEFDVAYTRLFDAGIKLVDRDRGWEAFRTARSMYAGRLNDMAQFWRIPPAQWVGDRSLISHHPPLRMGATRPVSLASK